MSGGKRYSKLVKGAPSGLVISLLVHAGAFLLAGLLVVFTVVTKEEKKFEPPAPVDRPKMKLKKPKVKVKKNAKPQSTTRIVTKIQKADMPDIQLPELGGMGSGLEGGSGIGGFDLMPDLSEVTLFGGGQTIGNDFIGTFYDFKRSPTGRDHPMSDERFVGELVQFVSGGWRPSRLSARYYSSPKNLYATSFVIPPIRSQIAPAAFDELGTIGYAWAVHYRGQLVYPKDIKFRFWGMGDDVLVVAVDKEVVLNACWPDGNWGTYAIGGNWTSSAENDYRYYMGNNLARGGDWIELKAGVPREMDVLIGEVPGGTFCSMLAAQVEGVEYPRNRQGGHIYPMFKTTEPSLSLQDAIYHDLVLGELSVTNGPIFRDYAVETRALESRTETNELVTTVMPDEPKSKMRIWTMDSGEQFEAEYIAVVGDKLTAKTAESKIIKVPVSRLNETDQEYIHSCPIEFRIK